MPYRRSYGRRRRFYGRKRYPKRKPSPTYAQIGYKVYKDVQWLKNQINTEFKYKDNVQGNSIDNAGVVQHLTNVPQGDGPSDRDGSQIRFKSVSARGKITMNPSATHTQFRIIFFIWKRVANTLPAVTDVLSSASTVALKNLDNRRNMVILSDKIYNLDANDREERNFKFYKKLDMKTLFTTGSTGGTVSDLEENGLFCLMISNQSTLTPTPIINFRTCYIDN